MTEQETVKAELLNRIDLGIAAENFLKSDVCKALTAQMDEEREDYTRALIDCPADDVKQNTALRLEISKREEWQFRIVGLKVDGDNAKVALEAMEAEQGE